MLIKRKDNGSKSVETLSKGSQNVVISSKLSECYYSGHKAERVKVSVALSNSAER